MSTPQKSAASPSPTAAESAEMGRRIQAESDARKVRTQATAEHISALEARNNYIIHLQVAYNLGPDEVLRYNPTSGMVERTTKAAAQLAALRAKTPIPMTPAKPTGGSS